MNSADYTSMLTNPEAVTQRQTDALEKIVAEFPYFQSARALRLKGLYSQNSFQYNYALKVTAAYTTDRSVLFDFITSDRFMTIQKGQYEEKAGFETQGQIQPEELSDKIEHKDTAELAKQSIQASIREASGESEPDQPTYDQTKTETFDSAEMYSVSNIGTDTTDTENPVIEPGQTEVEERGPIADDLQFLPEAVGPIEFVPLTLQAETESRQETTSDEVNLETSAEIEIEEKVVESEDETQYPVSNLQAEEVSTENQPEQFEEISDTAELSESKLEIGKPLEFTKTETHSFSEWLQLTKIKPIVREEEAHSAEIKIVATEIPVTVQDEKPEENDSNETFAAKFSNDELIDRFIESSPKIPKITKDLQPAVPAEPKIDHSSLMTETLARVYLEQKKYQKAIQAYEILILKYPEKSSFFADRILDIKNLQQNNNT